MCVRLYLPVLMVGLFTLIKMDSLIVWKRFAPLPTILKLYNVVMWSVVDWWPYIGVGAFRYSLNLSPNVLADSSMYSLLQSSLSQLYQYIISPFAYGPFPLVLQ